MKIKNAAKEGINSGDARCAEVWDDEIGCLDAGPHRCRRDESHGVHSCRCGSYVLELGWRMVPVDESKDW